MQCLSTYFFVFLTKLVMNKVHIMLWSLLTKSKIVPKFNGLCEAKIDLKLNDLGGD